MTTRASTRASTRSPASMRPLAATATAAAAAAATACATATATAARARGDRCERDATAGTTETTGDGYEDRGGLRRVDGAARAGDFAHRRCTGRTTRMQATGFAAVTSSAHGRGKWSTATGEGWGRQAPGYAQKNRRAETWLAGLRRSDAASKCQNCPPIFFGTCNYADFRGNFHHGAISSRGNVSGHCCSSADRVIITPLMTTQ
jgi:hypothetical protein